MSRYIKALANFSVAALIFTGVIVGLFSILGYFSESHFENDLLSHFRVQYFLILLLLTVVFLKHKRRAWPLFFAAMMVVNGFEIEPYYRTPRHASPKGHSANLRLMQINLWSMHEDYPKVLKAIKEANPDVISFQELTAHSQTTFERELPQYPFRIMRAQEDCFGIGIMSRYRLDEAEVFQAIDTAKQLESPPMVAAKLNFFGHPCKILSVHLLPPIYSRSCLTNQLSCQKIETICQETRPDTSEPGHPSLILIGDLNLTRHSSVFRKLARECRLEDSEEGFGFQPSFPTQVPLLRIPIDHCLYSSDLTVTHRQLGGYVGSDHFPLIVDLQIPLHSH